MSIGIVDTQIAKHERSLRVSKSLEVINYAVHDEIEEITVQRHWYKEAVFYEVYVRAFCDSNNDGHGDLQGLDTHYRLTFGRINK
jgi:hypothetical protein